MPVPWRSIASTPGSARPSRRRIAGGGRHAREIRVRRRRGLSADRHARRRAAATAAMPSGSPEHPGPVALGRIREAELRAAASVLGVREVSLLDYRDQHLDRANPREAVARIVGAPAAGPSRRRRDVRTGRRLRTSRSHRDLSVHDRGDRRRGRSRVRLRRRRRRRAACGVEAVLPRLAGIDVGRLPGGVQDADLHGRRRRAAGDAVAGLGDHHRDRYARRSGRRSGGRSRATSRRSPPTSG